MNFNRRRTRQLFSMNVNLLILKIQQKRRKEEECVEYTRGHVFMCRIHKEIPLMQWECHSLWLAWAMIICKNNKKESILILATIPATHSAHSSQWHCANALHILSPHCYWVPPTSLVLSSESESALCTQSLPLRSDGLTIAHKPSCIAIPALRFTVF